MQDSFTNRLANVYAAGNGGLSMRQNTFAGFQRSNSLMSNNNNNSRFFQQQQQPLQFQPPPPLANRSFSQQSFHSSQRSIHHTSSNNKPLIPFPPPRNQPPLSQESISPTPSLSSQSMFGSSQHSTLSSSSSSSSMVECLDALAKHERKLDEICLNQKQTNQMLVDLLHKLNSQKALTADVGMEKQSPRVTRRISVDLLAEREEDDDDTDRAVDEEDDLWKDDYPISAQDLFASGGGNKDEFMVELKRSQTFQTWRKTPPQAKRHCQS